MTSPYDSLYSADLHTRLRFVLQDHAEAMRFVVDFTRILHLWDDLIDRDTSVGDEAVNRAMVSALVSLPSNSFYVSNINTITPFVANAVANWHAANCFEATDNHRLLELAFVIRSDYANVLIHCAYLVGGVEWAIKVTPFVRDTWTNEDFDQYRKNLAVEITTRAERLKE